MNKKDKKKAFLILTSAIVAGYLYLENKDYISKYLSLTDVTHSNTATALGINNAITPEKMKNAQFFARHTINPVIELTGDVPIITSWYRIPELNTEVGGEPTSLHLNAFSIDYTVPDMLTHASKIYNSDIPYTELILEGAGEPENIHLAFNGINERRTFRFNGRTYYPITL